MRCDGHAAIFIVLKTSWCTFQHSDFHTIPCWTRCRESLSIILATTSAKKRMTVTSWKKSKARRKPDWNVNGVILRRHESDIQATAKRQHRDIKATWRQHYSDIQGTWRRHSSEIKTISGRHLNDIHATAKRYEATPKRHQSDTTATSSAWRRH